MPPVFLSAKASGALEIPPVAPERAASTEGLQAIAPSSGHQRIDFLDVAKGVGILLVVMGHCLGGLRAAEIVEEASLAWFSFYLIYSFHMPLFFFLTGSLVEIRVGAQPGRFLRTNVTRIAYPYFLWGLVQTIVQLLASGLITHPISQPPVELLIYMLWAPPAQFWFLYALFFLHLIALLTLLVGGRVLFMLVFSLVYASSAISPPVASFISSYVTGTNILFYVLGVCIGGPLIGWRGHLAQPYAYTIIAAIVFFSAVWVGWTTGGGLDTYATLPAAFAGCGAVLLLCRTDALRENPLLGYLGRRALPIYVLHVMFVAGARIVLVKAFHLSSVDLILPIIFLAGIAGPLVIDRAARSLRLRAALGLG